MALGPPKRASTIIQRQQSPPKRAPSIAESQQSRQMALAPPKRASTVVEPAPLYCRYSLDLQYAQNRNLVTSFAPGGSCQCPACGMQLDAESDDCWAIRKRATRWILVEGYKREIEEDVEFLVDQRFVVKCHTPEGDYACVLCSKYRDGDIICETADSLINHVGRTHDITELEREPDFQERAIPVGRDPY